MTRLVPLIALCLLAACGAGDAPTPRAVTSDEAKALKDAAEMLRAKRPPHVRPPAPAKAQ